MRLWDLGYLNSGTRETITVRVAPNRHGTAWFEYTACGNVRKNGQPDKAAILVSSSRMGAGV